MPISRWRCLRRLYDNRLTLSVSPAGWRVMAHDLAIEKFGIGQSVPRTEDPRLLRGEGRYTDDVNLPGQLHAVIVRSRYAHGTLRGIDTAEARAMPGVVAVY